MLIRVDLSPAMGGTLETEAFQGKGGSRMSDWEDWVRKATGGATSRQVGQRIGHSHTTALKWMRDGASPEAVIALAVAYNADVIGALVAAGWLPAEDVANLNFDAALRRLSSVKLTAEIHRRAIANAKEHNPDVFDQHRR